MNRSDDDRSWVVHSLTILALTLASTFPTRATSLCEREEKIAFSCKLSNNKWVSICRREKSGGDTLTYRFGRPDKVEMAYSDATGPESTFRYQSYFRYQVSYFDLSFKRNGHTYFVFRKWDEDNPIPKLGLDVAFPSGRDPLRLVCSSEVDDKNFGSTTDVACDSPATSMFGCERTTD